MSAEVNCPSCGGSNNGISPISRSLSCAHCGNLLYFNNNAWHSGGKFPTEIAAPPLLTVDRHGLLAGRSFRVAGRVRLEYSDGHWDEWWLEFEDGEDCWLEEDDGSYYFHQSQPVTTRPEDTINLAPGQMFNAGERSWFITEAGKATVIGVQGQLPVTLQPGFELNYFDAVTGGQTLSIEVWGNEIKASLAEPVNPVTIAWES